MQKSKFRKAKSLQVFRFNYSEYTQFNNKYKYNIYINNKFDLKGDTIFIYFIKKYSDKIETNKA